MADRPRGRREREGDEEDGARHVAEVKWMPARRKYRLPPGLRGVNLRQTLKSTLSPVTGCEVF